MQRERCIWARLYCLSSSSTAQLWARACQLVPPWILTMWKGRGSRRYEVRFWASSDWRVLRSPSDRIKSLIRSKRCITAPRSYWRSLGGIGSKVAVRTTQRQSTMPKRYTNSTWSTDRQRAVSITAPYTVASQVSINLPFLMSAIKASTVRNYAPIEERARCVNQSAVIGVYVTES